MSEHWTKSIRRENEALRMALDSALLALRTIPQSRLDKYAQAVDDESTLAYRKCAQEVDTLGLAAISEINDRLAEAL